MVEGEEAAVGEEAAAAVVVAAEAEAEEAVGEAGERLRST
jgi:hypothetical protein